MEKGKPRERERESDGGGGGGGVFLRGELFIGYGT